ncbi:MAG: polysaccharide pyruvyl transferase family protein [Rhodopirellula bahusiensis]
MKIAKKATRYIRESYMMGHFPSLRELCASGKPNLAYYGFLGDGNVGDELVFWATRELFSGCNVIPIKRCCPITVQAMSRHFRRSFSGIIQGGGTLIGPTKSCPFIEHFQEDGVPVFFHGTGVGRASPHESWIKVYENAFGGVRGPISNSWIHSRQPKQWFGDAAISLRFAQRLADTKSNRILINLGTHPYHSHDWEQATIATVVDFARYATANGNKVDFLPFHQIDFARTEQIRGLLPDVQVRPKPTSVEALNNEFRKCDFAFGERLHFVVAAALTGTPFFSINYAAKHVDFLESIGQLGSGLSPSDLTLDAVIKSHIESQGPPSKLIQAIRERQQREASRFLDAIASQTPRLSS